MTETTPTLQHTLAALFFMQHSVQQNLYFPMPIIREELSPKGNIIRKFGYFFVGLAIGFTVLGFFQKARSIELAKRRAAAAEAAKQPFVPALPVPPGADVVGTPAIPPK